MICTFVEFCDYSVATWSVSDASIDRYNGNNIIWEDSGGVIC